MGCILHIFLYTIYIMMQCTWGLPQTIAGLFVFLRHRKSPHSFYKGCIRTDWNRQDGVSLGLFIFVAGNHASPPEVASTEPTSAEVAYTKAASSEAASTAASSQQPSCRKTSSANERMARHEYGHTLQSLLLGPLYLLVIGLPSFLWCQLPFFQERRKRRHISYYSFFPERWADALGKADRKS